MTDIKCVECGNPMEEGHLSIYGGIALFTFVGWQKAKPKRISLKSPKDLTRMISSKIFGLATIKASHCKKCKQAFFSY